MNVLLDTHTLLWFLEGDKSLSEKARGIIENDTNTVHVSNISLFEITIKMKVQKLDTDKTMTDIIKGIEKSHLNLLPLNNDHLTYYQLVPFFDVNRDPFDRMIIATALAENLTIISKDPKFSLYTDIVQVVW